MPWTKEERKEYDRLNYQGKKERKKAYMKKYREVSDYINSDSAVKCRRIGKWKHRGILCFDYNLLYDIFLSTNRCEFCDVELNTNTSTLKCLDHDHNINDKFNVRGVLCMKCNFKDVFKDI